MSTGLAALWKPEVVPQARGPVRQVILLAHSPAGMALVSGVVLVPCFWLPRIHAGDLSSHLYNAWLAQLVREGKLEGLAVTWQWTNILFDLMLRALMSVGGPRIAERVAVAAAVLVFFGGAFAFVSVVSRRRPWFLAPCLAGLAYGWTFHMGFFNFYLSLGLCFWALAFFWQRSYRTPWPYLLLGAAILAHALPVAWAIGIVLYITVARRIRARRRWVATAAALSGIIAVRIVIELAFEAHWRFQQLAGMTGTDQFWVYDRKYFPVFVAVLALWSLLLLRLGESHGKLRTILGIPFQILVLTSAGILILPDFVLQPGHSIAFQFIGARMSLAAGVLACALLASSRPGRWERIGIPLVTASFFALLYADGARWDRIENEMTTRLRTLVAGQRVVSQLCLPGSRVEPLRHIVDRACIGWCFSYANYEPSSGQFSVRALGPNRVVAHERRTVWEIEAGQYTVKHEDIPLYQVEWEPETRGLRLRALTPGERAGQSCRTAVD